MRSEQGLVRAVVCLAVLMAWLMAWSAQGHGQLAAGHGAITGRVVDAETIQPLAGAAVELIPFGGRSASPQAAQRQSTLTDPQGEYRFDRLGPGRYRIRIDRLGYIADTVEVDLLPASTTRLSLALDVGPVLLPPVQVTSAETQPYGRVGSALPDANGDRAAVARSRQAEFLTADTREMTHADVVESATLVETDIFRALQRVPGVSTRDDYTATMWTRGASWDQTRVYFDGLPLFNPTHAGWLFSAVNPDAVGYVAFHPGVRPTQWGEGAAAILDLRSRSGGGNGEVRGRGELSLASARLALDGSSTDGRFQWMVAARRTYADLVTGVAGALTGSEDLYIPYDFSDVVARVDGRIGGGWEYRLSGIFERDYLRGDLPGLLQGNRGRWGNRSGQVSVRVPLGPVAARISSGETRFRAAVLKERPRRSAPRRTEPTLPALESLIRHQGLTVELGPRSNSGSGQSWSAGYQILRDSVGYEGPFSLLGELAVVLPRDTTPLSMLQLGSKLRHRAAWVERRFGFGKVELQAGLRAEFGDSVLNGGELRVAPRAAVRWWPEQHTALSAGWSRAWQYTQDIAPVGGPLGPQLHLTHLWVLAQRAGYSAVRAEIATAGIERWLGEEWLLGGTLYRRIASGVEVPNPDSGRVVPDRDPSVPAENAARGVELSVRKLSGSWTGSLGYSYGLSRMRAEVVDMDTTWFEFPSSAEIKHAVDVTALVQASPRLRVGGALTYGSGVPYTRLVLPDGSDPDASVRLGLANAMRTPSYASVDLLADYTRVVGTWQVTAYLQLRNLFDRDNAVTYSGSSTCGAGLARGARGGDGDRCRDGIADEFEAGVPRLPLIGARFSF